MLLCLSANHRSAPFELLERVSVGGTVIGGRLVAGSERVSGAVVVATCNRFEAYLDVAESDGRGVDSLARGAVETVAELASVDAAVLADSVEVLSGDDVIAHLFAVSSGLKSMVVGEDEIAGQVRRSLESARELGTATPSLERLFQGASRASRGVRARTAVGSAGRSVVRLALELASSRIPDWADARVVLVGTGNYAATTVAALRDRGAHNITVFSPTGRAHRFAAKNGLTASDDLAAALASSTIVITCTTRPGHVVTGDVLAPGARRLLVDLGLPRNIDPTVAEIDGIELLDLETIGLHAPLEQLAAADKAHRIVRSTAEEFAAQEAERAAAPAIAAFRQQAFTVLDSELARMRERGSWSEQSESELRHLVGVLLHEPSTRMRELAREGRVDDVVAAVETLLGPTPPEPVEGALRQAQRPGA